MRLRLPQSGLEVSFDEGVERFLIAQARAFTDVLAVLEGDHGRDAAHVVLAGEAAGFVAVVLGDHDAAVKGFGSLFEARGEHAAGTAPRSPEVDEDRDVGLGDDFFEVFVGDVNDFAHDDSCVRNCPDGLRACHVTVDLGPHGGAGINAAGLSARCCVRESGT